MEIKIDMKVCLFSSYSEKDTIDNYIKIYLDELKLYFDSVIFITNNKNLNNQELLYLSESNIEIKIVDNEGYDFGMWYKALQDIDIMSCEQIAFVNDSCILFNSLNGFFESMNSSDADYYGITDSNQISYHIQSYFIVARGSKCINSIFEYYKSNGIIKTGDVRQGVINVYEVGLSKYLIDNGFRLGSMFNCKNFYNSLHINISIMNSIDIINKGCPMIKKKLVFNTFTKKEKMNLDLQKINIDFDYISTIKNNKNDKIDINSLLS